MGFYPITHTVPSMLEKICANYFGFGILGMLSMVSHRDPIIIDINRRINIPLVEIISDTK